MPSPLINEDVLSEQLLDNLPRKLLADADARSSILFATQSLNVMTYFLGLLHCLDEDENIVVNVLLEIALALYFTLSLYAMYQNNRDINYASDSVEDEINKSFDVIVKINNEKTFQEKQKALSNIYVDPLNPFKLTLACQFKIEEEAQDYHLSWEIGSGFLFKNSRQLETIFKTLAKQKDLSFIKESQFPSTPRALQTWRMLLPHITHGIDLPSKMRALNYFGIPALNALNSLNFLLCKLSFGCNDLLRYPLYPFVGLVLFANIVESYQLNTAKTQLSLDGFTNVYLPYFQWPPTCIGKQITQKLALYPRNHDLNAALEFLFEGSQLLAKLKSSPDFENLPADAKENVMQFPQIFKEGKPSALQIASLFRSQPLSVDIREVDEKREASPTP